jgi:hypothetical protein
MRGIALLFVLTCITVYGCKDLGTEGSPIASAPPTPIAGRFVVDEYLVECEAKLNPRNDSIQACFPVKLRYHFEGSPGSVSTISFTFDRTVSVSLNIDGWPDSAGAMRSYTPSYWTTTALAQRESVLVECKLSGCYATYVGGNPQATESWAWCANRTVAVRR